MMKPNPTTSASTQAVLVSSPPQGVTTHLPAEKQIQTNHRRDEARPPVRFIELYQDFFTSFPDVKTGSRSSSRSTFSEQSASSVDTSVPSSSSSSRSSYPEPCSDKVNMIAARTKQLLRAKIESTKVERHTASSEQSPEQRETAHTNQEQPNAPKRWRPWETVERLPPSTLSQQHPHFVSRKGKERETASPDSSHSHRRVDTIPSAAPLGPPSASSSSLSGPVIYLQDACLLHKYIRTRDKSNVFERPERLRAINVGIAAAYARLEFATIARWEEDETINQTGKGTYRPFDVVRSDAAIPIHSHRSSALVHGQLGPPHDIVPYALRLERWCRDSRQAIAGNGSEIPETYEQDLYLCPESMTAFEGALGTVCEAVNAVMTTRPVEYTLPALKTPFLDARAFVAVRPPGHHCSEDTPMGFGFVNNVAVGAVHACREHRIRRVVIFDYDLHHGNGTQAIVRNINERFAPLESTTPPLDLRIFYGSMHDILSYPCEDGDPDLVEDASTCLYGEDGNWIENIHLQPYSTEEQFWKQYQNTYSGLFNTATRFLNATGGTNLDDVLVFISSGFDASEYETEDMSRHGRNVPTAFYHRFTRDACKFADNYANGRLISVLEGGYSDKALISGALAHITALADTDGVTDRDWWSPRCLDELEKATRKRRGRPSRTDNLDGWLRRTLELFESLETPVDSKSFTMKLPSLTSEVKQSMSEAVQKQTLKRSSRGAGPQTRAKRAKGFVDPKREHLEGPSEDE